MNTFSGFDLAIKTGQFFGDGAKSDVGSINSQEQRVDNDELVREHKERDPQG